MKLLIAVLGVSLLAYQITFEILPIYQRVIAALPQ